MERVFRVLLVDDEACVTDELSLLLGARTDLDLYTSSSALNALAVLKRTRIDLMISDIRMPGMSGLEVMKLARESGLTTDFIILSGYDDFNYARDAIRVGARAYLLKPLNITELYDELCHVCASRTDQKPNAGYIKKLTENFIRNLISGHIMNQGSLDNMLSTTGTVLHNGACYCVCISWKEPILRSSAESARILRVIEGHAWKDPHFFVVYDESQIAGVCNCGAGDPAGDSNRLLQLFAQEKNYGLHRFPAISNRVWG